MPLLCSEGGGGDSSRKKSGESCRQKVEMDVHRRRRNRLRASATLRTQIHHAASFLLDIQLLLLRGPRKGAPKVEAFLCAARALLWGTPPSSLSAPHTKAHDRRDPLSFLPSFLLVPLSFFAVMSVRPKTIQDGDEK